MPRTQPAEKLVSAGVHLAVQYRPLSDVRPYPRNARRHSAVQIEAIKRSLSTFGWTAPILIADGEIIAGHARHEAARQLSDESGKINGAPDPSIAPMIDLSHLPAEQRRAYVVADNRLAELAAWDFELLRGEVADLAGAGFDNTLLGYTTPELATLMNGWQTDVGKVASTDAHATSQLGLVLVRCARPQIPDVERAVRLALEGMADITISVQGGKADG